jgi:hypothetical protein
MSADSSPPQETLPGDRTAFIQWLVIGAAGVAFAFVASVHLPDAIKLPGVLTIGLGGVAGWGWGRFGQSMHIAPSRFVAVVIWIAIAGAELLGGWKSHQDRATDKTRKLEPILNDPIAIAIRETLQREPENETPDLRDFRLQQLAKMDQDDATRLKQLEFHAYLASRIDRLKNHTLKSYPWPELIWGIEILCGSTLGAWLAVSILQTRPPATAAPA